MPSESQATQQVFHYGSSNTVDSGMPGTTATIPVHSVSVAYSTRTFKASALNLVNLKSDDTCTRREK